MVAISLAAMMVMILLALSALVISPRRGRPPKKHRGHCGRANSSHLALSRKGIGGSGCLGAASLGWLSVNGHSPRVGELTPYQKIRQLPVYSINPNSLATGHLREQISNHRDGGRSDEHDKNAWEDEKH
jgi:hypothetical protein